MESVTCTPTATGEASSMPYLNGAPPQLMMLDYFFPGFSVFSNFVSKYLRVDLNLYIPLLLLFGGLTFAWNYVSNYIWSEIEGHFMSAVDIRTDDEIYNVLMTWIATQSFAQRSRRFVVNASLGYRSWYYRYDEDDEETEDEFGRSKEKKKPLYYTPTFGSHYFWYRGRLLIFSRSQNREQSQLMTSEREEISLSTFGRSPWLLKELLQEARDMYNKRDEDRTLIYRASSRSGGLDVSWQRSLARANRPFSTVILNEKVKQDLIDDVADYLNPATRRWYSNRGIPYRRGYLLYGPPGTGKSSLSLALAGHFKLRIYMVSLNSVNATEETLASLFNELPRRCVVLLEDIDTAGLTHTREEDSQAPPESSPSDEVKSTPSTPGLPTPDGRSPNAVVPTPPNNNSTGRLSLSGLLNILDGVASQEGRVLIMTTNHLEKLDKALIRPGRVDRIVHFGRADREMSAAIFRALFAPLEADAPPALPCDDMSIEAEEKRAAKKAADAKKLAEDGARVGRLAERFAAEVPAHEFSPAELQGFLLKNKRDPAAAVESVGRWVVETRKEKKEKELKEAEEKRNEDEKRRKEREAEAEKEAAEKKEKEEKEEKEAAEKQKQKEKEKEKEKKQGGDEKEDNKEQETKQKPQTKRISKKAKKADDKKTSDYSEPSSSELEEDEMSPPPFKTGKAGELAKLAADEAKQAGDSGYGTP